MNLEKELHIINFEFKKTLRIINDLFYILMIIFILNPFI